MTEEDKARLLAGVLDGSIVSVHVTNPERAAQARRERFVGEHHGHGLPGFVCVAIVDHDADEGVTVYWGRPE